MIYSRDALRRARRTWNGRKGLLCPWKECCHCRIDELWKWRLGEIFRLTQKLAWSVPRPYIRYNAPRPWLLIASKNTLRIASFIHSSDEFSRPSAHISHSQYCRIRPTLLNSDQSCMQSFILQTLSYCCFVLTVSFHCKCYYLVIYCFRGCSVAIWRPQIQFRIPWFGVILPARPQKFDVSLTAQRTPE